MTEVLGCARPLGFRPLSQVIPCFLPMLEAKGPIPIFRGCPNDYKLSGLKSIEMWIWVSSGGQSFDIKVLVRSAPSEGSREHLCLPVAAGML